MALENALWHFALKFYAQPGVETACLELQNRFGLSINRLIWSCWAAQQGIALAPDDFLEAPAQQWQQQITVPLREVRYRVRQQRSEQQDLDACYQALRKAELACEQVELALLYAAVSERKPGAGGAELLDNNLRQYLKTRAVVVAEVWPLLEPLQQAAGQINHG